MSIPEQQLREQAWSLVLDHSDWAETVRARLGALSAEPDRRERAALLELWRQGPALPGPWGQPESLEGWAELSALLQEALHPGHEVAVAWQWSKARDQDVFTPLIRVDEHLWRGPQPDLERLRALQGEGLRAIISLRRESPESLDYARQLGMFAQHVDVLDMSVPRLDQVLGFLDHFEHGREVPALVHCFAGQGRTGLFVASYRIWRGMESGAAIELTDRESRRRGMRAAQKDWVQRHQEALRNYARRD